MTIEPDLSSTSMTFGVTTGISTVASPQSFGSNVVLPVSVSVDMVAVPVGTSSVVGSAAVVVVDGSVVVTGSVMMPVIELLLAVVSTCLPSSPQPTRPTATRLENNARFISGRFLRELGEVEDRGRGPSSWTPKHGPCPGVRDGHYTDRAGPSQLSCEVQICAARARTSARPR
ncbi:hypothetical protein [Nannocystis pusilla]|uniref:hypothetical protein n=1 Tax=Nannocystis pusilla TaxID=889268 RepID=UPI003B7E235C